MKTLARNHSKNQPLKEKWEDCLGLERFCLDELRECNDEFEALLRNVKQSEGHVKVLKDRKVVEARTVGNACSAGALVGSA
jgi:hypothetical protein